MRFERSINFEAMPSEPNLPSSRASDTLPLPSTPPEIATISQNTVPMSGVPAVPAPPLPARPRGRELEPLSADRFGVHFTVDAELRELIERARALASHQLPNGDLAGLIKLMAARFVRQEEKRRFGIGARSRRAKVETVMPRATEREAPPGGVLVSAAVSEPTPREVGAVPAGERGRYLAMAVRREIHGRDNGQCAFVSADGRRCTARAFLEFDHVRPRARSGASDASNLRLLCKAHNLQHARKVLWSEACRRENRCQEASRSGDTFEKVRRERPTERLRRVASRCDAGSRTPHSGKRTTEYRVAFPALTASNQPASSAPMRSTSATRAWACDSSLRAPMKQGRSAKWPFTRVVLGMC